MFLMLERNGLATSPKITTEYDIVQLIQSAYLSLSENRLGEATEFAIKAMDCCDEIYPNDEMNWKKYYLQSLSVYIKSFRQGLGLDETIELLNSLHLTSLESKNPLLSPIVKCVFENLPQKDYHFSEQKQAFMKR
jgi:hypothetical protein